MKALLIIDMQKGSFNPYTLRHDTIGVIGRINKLAAYFRANNHKVVFIQHDGTKEGSFLPGTYEWEILPELTIHTTDLTISKIANDSFYKTDLLTVLTDSNITELVITGCATDFCVDATIKSAISKDFHITVIEDAHTTANRPHVTAPALIHHYNWLWADMTATRTKVDVVKTRDFLRNIGGTY